MDQQKAERLIALHADAVYRMAYIKTGKREDAEDITQETFLRMLRCGKTFRDEEHRRAWLLRVANNYAVDLLRAPWHKRCSSLEEVQAAAPVSEPELSEVLDAAGNILPLAAEGTDVYLDIAIDRSTGLRYLTYYYPNAEIDVPALAEQVCFYCADAYELHEEEAVYIPLMQQAKP